VVKITDDDPLPTISVADAQVVEGNSGSKNMAFTVSLSAPSGRDVKFTLKNAGDRAGAETAQVYVTLPASAGEPFKRLVAWQKVQLQPGESKEVSVSLDPAYLSVFNTKKHGWELKPGKYQVYVGGSAQTSALNGSSQISR